MFKQSPTSQLILKADRGTPHSLVVAIMEKAKTAGLRNLAISTPGGR
jgi:biopolymer transport protein ExbD